MQPLQHEDLVEDIVFPTHGNSAMIDLPCSNLVYCVARWSSGYRAGLAIDRSLGRIPAVIGCNPGQVVHTHTHVLLSPSSITSQRAVMLYGWSSNQRRRKEL